MCVATADDIKVVAAGGEYGDHEPVEGGHVDTVTLKHFLQNPSNMCTSYNQVQIRCDRRYRMYKIMHILYVPI